MTQRPTSRQLGQTNKELQPEIEQHKQVQDALLENTRRLKVAYEQACLFTEIQ